jgi:hypothetical protein
MVLLNRKLLLSMVFLSLCVGLIAVQSISANNNNNDKNGNRSHHQDGMADYSLFSGESTPADTGAKCGSTKAFVFYLTVENVGSTPDAVNILFLDAKGTQTDSLLIRLAPDQTVSLSQAAGSDQTSDAIIQVVIGSSTTTMPDGTHTPSHVAGWVSLLNVGNGKPLFNGNYCVTTQT